MHPAYFPKGLQLFSVPTLFFYLKLKYFFQKSVGVTIPPFKASTYAVDVAGLVTYNHDNQEMFSFFLFFFFFWPCQSILSFLIFRQKQRQKLPPSNRPSTESCWKMCAVPESCKLVVSQLLALWSTFCEDSIMLAT